MFDPLRVSVMLDSNGSNTTAVAAVVIGGGSLSGGEGSIVGALIGALLLLRTEHALAARDFRVRTYCPVGDLVAGMAYLVRRLLENTSNESFLHEQAAGRSLDELLAAP